MVFLPIESLGFIYQLTTMGAHIVLHMVHLTVSFTDFSWNLEIVLETSIVPDIDFITSTFAGVVQ